MGAVVGCVSERGRSEQPMQTNFAVARCCLLLLCCAVGFPAVADAPSIAAFASAGSAPQAPWRVVGLPDQRKPYSRFSLADIDGQHVLRVEANRSYGNLVHPLVPMAGPTHLVWSWRAERLLPDADLRTRSGDDSPLKVCVFFDLPIERVPFIERQLLRAVRVRSADLVPTATVCYVWDNRLAVGTALDNAYTRRLRIIVLQSGEAHLHHWRHERRDVIADFMQLFGDEANVAPPIIGVAVGADADNTGGDSLGYVGDLVLEP